MPKNDLFALPEIRLVRYRSPKAILTAHWQLKEQGFTWEEFLEAEAHAADLRGRPVQFTPRDMVRWIEEEGFWGYAETQAKPPVVHVWVSPNAKPDQVRFFLAHEIGHLVGKPVKSDVKEEERAHTYGQAALLSEKWLRKITDGKTQGQRTRRAMAARPARRA